jgi:hypothetical protein
VISSIRRHHASQPTSLSAPVPVQPRQTRGYFSHSLRRRSIGPSMCQSGAPFAAPNGHSGSKLSFSCDGAPGASGMTAHRPGWNSRGSNQSKYGVQSSRMNHGSPRFTAAIHSENAPLSKHDVGAQSLDCLHVVRIPEAHAERSVSADVIQRSARSERGSVVDGRGGHSSTPDPRRQRQCEAQRHGSGEDEISDSEMSARHATFRSKYPRRLSSSTSASVVAS